MTYKNKETRNFGFIAPTIVPEDYFLGSGLLGSQEINPSGNWLNFLPIFEPQSKTIDVNGCVSFAMNSCAEILHKFLYQTEPNYSDRFLASISETKPEKGGNTPKKVAVSFRASGAIPETEYPFVDNLAEYYQEIPQQLKDMGLEFLKNYSWGYEWVDSALLKNALRKSPVGCAVSAWQTNDKNEYIRFGVSNHYVVLVAFDEQDRPIIFDSYEKNLKTLEKNFKLEFTQMYTLTKKTPEIKKNFLRVIHNWFLSLLTKLGIL